MSRLRIRLFVLHSGAGHFPICSAMQLDDSLIGYFAEVPVCDEF